MSIIRSARPLSQLSSSYISVLPLSLLPWDVRVLLGCSSFVPDRRPSSRPLLPRSFPFRIDSSLHCTVD